MSTDDFAPNFVPLKSSLSLRFYEAVLLLYCLKEVKYNADSVKEPEPDLETDNGKSSRNAFRCFVDKLGQICDNGLAGKTVTAFAVLQPGEIQYRFASNQRTNEELKEVKRYIENILDILGSTDDDELSGVYGAVLQRVIAFNRPTITQYIKNLTLEEWMDHCVKVCKEENIPEGYTSRDAVRDINFLARFRPLGERLGPDNFVTQTRELLETIDQLYNSPFNSFIREKARADRDPAAKTPWSELRHAFGRLQSYNIAIKVLISMRRRRRELFEGFNVIPVPSSVPSSCPNVRRSVERIFDRFPKDMRIAEAYHLNLPKEQKGELEELINTYGTGSRGRFKPYVHAELVLLNSVLTEEQREGIPLRFFAEADYDRYIGSSKATCRLCKLYIDNHPSGVEFRQSHGNIYRNWRAPDICKDGVNVDQLTKTREHIHNKMVESLRQTIMRTIVDNVVERRHHDSASSPTSYIGASSSTGNSHMAAQAVPYHMDSISTRGEMDDSDDVVATLGKLSIVGDGGRPSSSPSVGRSSQDTTPVPECNVGSPSESPAGLKPSMNRRQRPLIIEVDDSE